MPTSIIIEQMDTVKNIVLMGFGHITLLDLDTIDLSNLNRQALFKKRDVKQSNALVRRLCSFTSFQRQFILHQQEAAQTAGVFNPNVHIYPIHGNIKEPQFDIVLNALDNLGESACGIYFRT
jgi:ubiquitin-like 1-activating enzyme E1 B